MSTLTLGQKQAMHGRPFVQHDPAWGPYCTECLADLPADMLAQRAHVCQRPDTGAAAPPVPVVTTEPHSSARPVKGLRRYGDLALSRERQANGDVRYTVHRVTDDGAVRTALFIDRDRWERDESERYKVFLANVLQSGGFFPGASYVAKQINYGRTLAEAVAGCRPTLDLNPVGALDE